jgi:hypothetical protein
MDTTEPTEQPSVNFPHYPQGTHTADRKQAGILHKLVGRMLKPKMKLKVRSPRGKKGLSSNQSVGIKHRKTKWY